MTRVWQGEGTGTSPTSFREEKISYNDEQVAARDTGASPSSSREGK